MIACAVPSASLPIRNTAVLPVRSTPVASANTFGRPSNTNPTTPSGARHDDADHPFVFDARQLLVSTSRRRRPAAQAGDHPGPHRASQPQPVVERPVRERRFDVGRVGRASGRTTSASSAGRRTAEEAEICSSVHAASAANASTAAARPPARPGRPRHVQQVPGLLDDDQAVAGAERRGQRGSTAATRSPPKTIAWPAASRELPASQAGHRRIRRRAYAGRGVPTGEAQPRRPASTSASCCPGATSPSTIRSPRRWSTSSTPSATARPAMRARRSRVRGRDSSTVAADGMRSPACSPRTTTPTMSADR